MFVAFTFTGVKKERAVYLDFVLDVLFILTALLNTDLSEYAPDLPIYYAVSVHWPMKWRLQTQ